SLGFGASRISPGRQTRRRNYRNGRSDRLHHLPRSGNVRGRSETPPESSFLVSGVGSLWVCFWKSQSVTIPILSRMDAILSCHRQAAGQRKQNTSLTRDYSWPTRNQGCATQV